MIDCSKFRKFSAVAGLILAVLAPSLVPVSAEAQIRATRKVDYDFIVEQPIVSFAKIQELRPEGSVINAWMTLIPDKTIPDSGGGSRLIAVLKEAATRMSRSFQSSAEYNGVLGIRPKIANDVVDFSGATLKLKVSFVNDPNHEDLLREQNFTRLDSKTAKLKGGTYTLTRWVKRDGDLGSVLGTASAQLDLKANPTIGDISSEFNANFERISRREFDLTGAPTSERGRKLARARYKIFKDELNRKFSEVLATLNEPQPMISEEERLGLADLEAGTVIKFKRKIPYTWYGEKKTVDVVVTATLGGLRYLDDSDEELIKPFRDD